MHTGKSKLLRAIAAEERRQERDEKRAMRGRAVTRCTVAGGHRSELFGSPDIVFDYTADGVRRSIEGGNIRCRHAYCFCPPSQRNSIVKLDLSAAG